MESVKHKIVNDSKLKITWDSIDDEVWEDVWDNTCYSIPPNDADVWFMLRSVMRERYDFS